MNLHEYQAKYLFADMACLYLHVFPVLLLMRLLLPLKS